MGAQLRVSLKPLGTIDSVYHTPLGVPYSVYPSVYHTKKNNSSERHTCTEKTRILFPFKLDGIWSWGQFSFQFSEPNGIPFGLKSKEKLSSRSYPIHFERKWKYMFSQCSKSNTSVQLSESLQRLSKLWGLNWGPPQHSIVLRGLRKEQSTLLYWGV